MTYVAHAGSVLLLLSFYCSYRNKNEPSATYPSFERRRDVLRVLQMLKFTTVFY
jgi:hypothetical protein